MRLPRTAASSGSASSASLSDCAGGRDDPREPALLEFRAAALPDGGDLQPRGPGPAAQQVERAARPRSG